MSNDSEAVILKVFEAVSAALDEFHLSVEAFGDVIILGTAENEFFEEIPLMGSERSQRKNEERLIDR